MATTAERRDEWSYSAALEAVQDGLPLAGSEPKPFGQSDTPVPGPTPPRRYLCRLERGSASERSRGAPGSTVGAGVDDSGATSGRYQTRRTRSSARNQRMMFGAVGAVVLIGGAIGFLVVSNNQSAPHRALDTTTSKQGSPISHSGTTSLSPNPPVTESAAQVMASLARYIGQSVAVRPTVENAIDGVESCAISPLSGETMLR